MKNFPSVRRFATPEKVKAMRERTGVGMNEVALAFEMCHGMEEYVYQWLEVRGRAVAYKNGFKPEIDIERRAFEAYQQVVASLKAIGLPTGDITGIKHTPPPVDNGPIDRMTKQSRYECQCGTVIHTSKVQRWCGECKEKMVEKLLPNPTPTSGSPVRKKECNCRAFWDVDKCTGKC